MSGIVGHVGAKSGIIGQKTKLVYDRNLDRPGDGPYDVDEFTTLLIHSDTTNNSQIFIDSSPLAHRVTHSGQTKHDTATAKIGATSIVFDGTGDILQAASAGHVNYESSNAQTAFESDYDFRYGDFTVEFWVKTNSSSSADRIISVGAGNGPPMQFFVRSAGDASEHIKIGFPDNTVNLNYATSAVDLQDNNWHHWALVKDTARMYLTIYVDGIQRAQNTSNVNGFFGYQAGVPFHFGSYYTNNSSENFTGYLDEIRVSKGIARWTSNFKVY